MKGYDKSMARKIPNTICKICRKEKYNYSMGLCKVCHTKAKQDGTLDKYITKCKAQGCDKNARLDEYCDRHYKQVWQYGKILDNNPNRTKRDRNEININNELNCAEIYLYDHNGYFKNKALIDIEDIEKVKSYKWNCSNNYVRTNTENIQSPLHRFILNITDDNIVVDHINRNPLDNRKSNLRIASSQQNAFNLTTNNQFGISGIYYDNENSKYNVRLKYDYKLLNLGQYKTLEEARKIRLLAELKFFKEFSPNYNLFEEYNIKEDDLYIIDNILNNKKEIKEYIAGIQIREGRSNYKVETKYKGKRYFLGNFNDLNSAVIAKLKWEKEIKGESSQYKDLFEQYNIV